MRQRLYIWNEALSDALNLSKVQKNLKNLGSTIESDCLHTMYWLLSDETVRIGVPLSDSLCLRFEYNSSTVYESGN